MVKFTACPDSSRDADYMGVGARVTCPPCGLLEQLWCSQLALSPLSIGCLHTL